MHPTADSIHEGEHARRAGAAWLAQALQDSRRDTLATFAAYEAALGPTLAVPCRAGLNPPLWELGHIGWFQEFWLARNPERAAGLRADPDVARPEGVRAGAEALYHSSRVAHAARWSLPLPDAQATRDDLQRQLEATLDGLQRLPEDDVSLYFHRLTLFHEDMHHEAALYMARGLGVPIADVRWRPRPLAEPRVERNCGPVQHRMAPEPQGFHFDNEGAGRSEALAAYRIDSRVLNWAEYLPFVEAGGYAERRLWSDDGWRWLQQSGLQAPLYLRRDGATWLQRQATGWQALDQAQPAEHLSAHEAGAWCRWAGRRLPTEAEWEHAALKLGDGFEWGDVWEWTASPFAPFDGFEAHPYRDYSRPWFDGRPVLRGASYLTQPRLRHRRYRNYFTAERNDIVAGLRSCALG